MSETGQVLRFAIWKLLTLERIKEILITAPPEPCRLEGSDEKGLFIMAGLFSETAHGFSLHGTESNRLGVTFDFVHGGF